MLLTIGYSGLVKTGSTSRKMSRELSVHQTQQFYKLLKIKESFYEC